MSEQKAPERIYVDAGSAALIFNDRDEDEDIEYIRADIAERYRAALNKARADLIGAVQRNDLDVNAMLRRIGKK